MHAMRGDHDLNLLIILDALIACFRILQQNGCRKEKASDPNNTYRRLPYALYLVVHGMRGDLISPAQWWWWVMVGAKEVIRTLESWVGGVAGQAGREAGVIEGILSVGGAGVRGVWRLGVGSSCSRCTWSVRSKGIVFPQVRQWQLAKSGNHQAAARSVGSSGISSRLWISVQQ